MLRDVENKDGNNIATVCANNASELLGALELNHIDPLPVFRARKTAFSARVICSKVTQPPARGNRKTQARWIMFRSPIGKVDACSLRLVRPKCGAGFYNGPK